MGGWQTENSKMGQLPPLFQGTQMMWQEQLGPAKAMGVCPIEQPKAKACRLLPGLWWGRFPSGFLPALLKPWPPQRPHKVPALCKTQHLYLACTDLRSRAPAPAFPRAQSHGPRPVHPQRTASLFHFCKVGVGATDRVEEGLRFPAPPFPAPSFWQVPGSSLPHCVQHLYRGKAGGVSELP